MNPPTQARLLNIYEHFYQWRYYHEQHHGRNAAYDAVTDLLELIEKMGDFFGFKGRLTALRRRCDVKVRFDLERGAEVEDLDLAPREIN